jgi:uncharacterized SAM-dependent methyltransferase
MTEMLLQGRSAALRQADKFAVPAADPALVRDVIEGLGASQKTLPSRWFYDDEGSRLFQKIMSLPEYYLTRTEHSILRHRSKELVNWIAPNRRPVDLIELGSGDGEKTISLCKALYGDGIECTFHPIDVSDHALSELRHRFAMNLPGMRVRPILGDYFEHWPTVPASRRQVAMLLGSNLGNLSYEQSVALLSRIRSRLSVLQVRAVQSFELSLFAGCWPCV